MTWVSMIVLAGLGVNLISRIFYRVGTPLFFGDSIFWTVKLLCHLIWVVLVSFNEHLHTWQSKF